MYLVCCFSQSYAYLINLPRKTALSFVVRRACFFQIKSISLLSEREKQGNSMPTRSKTKSVKIVEVPNVDQYGHKQPQSLDMEEAVLGALMIDQEAYALVAEILKPESFYDKRNQLIYKAIQELSTEQRPVDIMTVQDQLQSNGELEEAGGTPYIMQINMKIGSSAHIEYHARVIAQKALARQLITFSSYVQTCAYDPTMDVKDLMQEAEAQLYAISQQNMKKDYTQSDPVITDVFNMINKAAAQKDGMSGIPTGFEKLDKITNGWQKSDLIIIAARPSMGKTAFALSMIKRMAVDYRRPVAIFSLEMSNQQLVQRLLVNVTEISGEKLRSGQLMQHEWEQLDLRSRQLTGAPIYVDDTPAITNYELITKARRLVREHGVECIMIDYLQLMHAKGLNINSRQEEVAAVSQSLKGLAKDLNIPVIALAQLNREGEKREGFDQKRPLLSDLRDSGSIEQDADIVCFIHRPEYYRLDKDDHGNDWRGKAMFIIAKHRNGSVGDIRLDFQKEFARFADEQPSGIPKMGGADAGGTFSSPQLSDEELQQQEDLTNQMMGSDPFASLSPDDEPPF